MRQLVLVGLLKQEPDGVLQLHCLLAAFTRSSLADADAQAAVEAALLQEAERCNARGDFWVVERWAAHLQWVADAAFHRTDIQTAALEHWLSVYLSLVGVYSAAQRRCERALALREQALGPRHPATATSLNILAELLQAQGDSTAHPLYQRALAIREQVLGPRHPDTQLVRNNLAHLDQITTILDDADAAIAVAQTPEARTTLAAHLDAQAQWVEDGEAPGSPYLALATQLRTRAAQLRAEAALDTSPDA